MSQKKRKAAEIDPLDLWALFGKKFDGDNHYDLQEIDKIGKDIEKVNFDFENCEYGPVPDLDDSLTGLRATYVQGGYLSFIGVTAGGDWEFPVFFIIYLDQDRKTFRGYIPKDGNVWNWDTKQAIGNDEDKDSDFLKKWLKKNNPDAYSYAVDSGNENGLIDWESWVEYMQHNGLMKRDIASRIEVK